MFRILFYFLLIFALGLGFAWLAERPGDLVVTFGGYRYEVTLMVAAVLLVGVVAAVMITWWLLKSIWYSPKTVARHFRVRRRDRGYQALSTGLIAAGAGDGGVARRMGTQASKLISSDQEPLIHLLDAQAAMLEGDHETARKKFAAMAEDPETRLLGLRGLYLEAERLGEREAAEHYAGEAAKQAPQLGWAANAALATRAREGEWDSALSLVDAQKSAKHQDKDAIKRRRAVLLTAKAMEVLDSDPATARSAALEAHKLQPEFVPAAVTAAKALFRNNELRKAAKVLESTWKKEPHPELAEAYLHARPGDSTHDRLDRARKLRGLKPNNVESELAVARAALDASEYAEARKAAEAAIRIAPRESAFLILADIEEAETGEQGRVRHWLQKALRAPRDPAWIADGQVSERWAPVSPSGRFDAYEWRVPVERLAPVLDADDALEPLPAISAPPAGASSAGRSEDAEIVVEEGLTEVKPPVAGKAKPNEPDASSDKGDAVKADEVQETPKAEPKLQAATAAPVKESKPDAVVADAAEAQPKPVADTSAPATAHRKRLAEEDKVKRPPIPDDPGVDPEDDAKPQQGFRLF
ncbi:heme biosynthesis HemY N-terminal domain-containing protein [Nitratireductor basaltis]|uniref:Putative membrane-bound protein n=1 Tax=Nitratireductor basaltis TaxID=472175 RepID=A0A084U760_9HYPH|nr:heme biosynthesis HemY N-terminal domain-containing protein [Nitratireductor basaltis]KFB08796.1 putative membrane-bound protein precursor [Nitratireductor basaltis]